MNNQTPQNRGRVVPILLIIVLLFSMYYMFNNTSATPPEDYSTIEQLFRDGEIAAFKLNFHSGGTGELEYRLKSDEGDELKHAFDVPDVYIFLNDIKPHVEEYNSEHPLKPIEYTYVTTTNVWTVIWSLLPTVLLFGGIIFLFYMMNKQGGNRIGSVTKARVRGEQDASRRVGFADVAGADEEKEELAEIVQYLKNPSQFNSLGAKIPKGVLLVGPPGTGKTLLARAVAGEAGVPFYSISGSDFVELYVGAGAARVRDLFDKAKKTRPSIIFIDEIDAVGRKRGTGLGGGHDEREQTLNQLLVEMDGFGTNEGVVVIAATNRSDILDPALLRSGRFDREVYVGMPDVKGREEILRVHAKGKPLGPDVDLSVIAKTTPGFTGADLENLLNEAALLAAKRNRKAITEKDIEESAMKIMAGAEKKSRVVTPKERRLTAYHEAGHAIATYVMKPSDPVHQISIIPRGMMGGYTMSLPEDDKRFMTRNEMSGEIVTLLGGRVAEHLVLDDISTGASNDLERATDIARSMVTRYGFSDKLGPVVYSSNDEVFLGRDFMQSRSYSEKIATDIDTEIHSIIEGAYITCDKILKENIQGLHRVANALLEKEKIDGAEFKRLMEEPESLLS